MGCAASVQLALSALPGVHEAAVDLAARQARVIYDPSQAELDQMAEAVAEAGYRVARNGYQVARSGYQVARIYSTAPPVNPPKYWAFHHFYLPSVKER